MIRYLMFLAISVLGLSLTTIASAQSSATAFVTATVVDPVDLTGSTSVILQPIPSEGKSPSADIGFLRITGNNTNTYVITFPSDAIEVASDREKGKIQVTGFASKRTGNGPQDLKIRATFLMDQETKPGDYAGSYLVIVEYN